MGKMGLVLSAAMLLGSVQVALCGDGLDNGGKNPGDSVNKPCQLKCNKMSSTGGGTTMAMKKTTTVKPAGTPTPDPKATPANH